MDVWLLGSLAIVLIAITLWIVWPGPTAEAAGAIVRREEERPMIPQGDQFEDQYTSATADLSAGGVATAMDAMQARQTTPAAPAFRPVSEPVPLPPGAHTSRPGSLMVGAAALLVASGAVGGAWLYARWQRNHNTPANRLRRRLLRR